MRMCQGQTISPTTSYSLVTKHLLVLNSCFLLLQLRFLTKQLLPLVPAQLQSVISSICMLGALRNSPAFPADSRGAMALAEYNMISYNMTNIGTLQ